MFVVLRITNLKNMKNLILVLGCFLFFNSVYAQEGFLSLSVKDLKGKTKMVSEYVAKEGFTVFVFWRGCCPNSLGMLSSLQEAINESEESETPLTFVLVALDDSRSAGRVRPIVGSYGWTGSVILDGNQELSRRTNIIIPPQWLVVNPKGEEVFRCKIVSSATGVEYYFNQIKSLKLN